MSVRKLKENKITKDGRSWVFIQYSKGLDGKRHQYQSQAYMTEDEAIQAEKIYLNKYKDVEVNPHMTFKEAYTIYYDYQKDKIKDSTLKTYRDRIKYMGLLDNVELVNLNWDLYQKWRAQMNKTNLCDRYKTDIQKFIKQVINFAEKQWDFNLRKFYNKLEPFKTPGALKKEMDFYEPEEFFKFISVVDDLRYKCFFELLYYCGLRRSEARGLQWKHIDFNNKTLTVSQQVLNPSNSNASTEWYISSTKTEASNRTIPISTTLLNDLAELKKTNERLSKFKQTWFVLGDDVPMATGRMYFYRDKYAKKAGIRRIRLHDFRHSCASALISGAAPITAVSNFLGHSETTETLETYTHMFKKDLANVPKFFDTLEKDFNEKSSE
ncbi:MAG: site-specific integrase [Mollicutes bacterium]|nr:site-specific integrase [Mollicutes bacterium]